MTQRGVVPEARLENARDNYEVGRGRHTGSNPRLQNVLAPDESASCRSGLELRLTGEYQSDSSSKPPRGHTTLRHHDVPCTSKIATLDNRPFISVIRLYPFPHERSSQLSAYCTSQLSPVRFCVRVAATRIVTTTTRFVIQVHFRDTAIAAHPGTRPSLYSIR